MTGRLHSLWKMNSILSSHLLLIYRFSASVNFLSKPTLNEPSNKIIRGVTVHVSLQKPPLQKKERKKETTSSAKVVDAYWSVDTLLEFSHISGPSAYHSWQDGLRHADWRTAPAPQQPRWKNKPVPETSWAQHPSDLREKTRQVKLLLYKLWHISQLNSSFLK